MEIVGLGLSNSNNLFLGLAIISSFIFLSMLILYLVNKGTKAFKIIISIFIYLIFSFGFIFLLSLNSQFELSIFYTNKTNAEINIKKEDIINEILNNNIKEVSNSKVYRQTFEISREEYYKLYDIRNKIKQDNTYGKVNITD